MMSNNKRVKVQSIVENQLPAFIREEFPLAGEFLKQYYISQEYQGSSYDIIQNIDQYIKLDSLTNLQETSTLAYDISFSDTTIEIFSTGTPSPTAGFPDRFGLIKIGDEIISYEYKTSRTFEGCVRGFSGTYEDSSNELVFSDTFAQSHTQGDIVTNLSVLFLKKFLTKLKEQIFPGFSERDLFEGQNENGQSIKVNENIFIKQSRDFYTSKGTDDSFKILFGALYGERVEVIKPRDYLFKPSDAGYTKTKDIVVEAIEGNPLDIVNKTLYQDEYDSYDIPKSYASITQVEKLQFGNDVFYKLSYDSDFNRDIILDGVLYGDFKVHAKTKATSNVSVGSSVIYVDSTVGFPTGGTLVYTSEDGLENHITYSSKSVTEFYGVQGLSREITAETDVRLDVYAYAYTGITTENQVKVRIGSVLNQFVYDENNRYFEKDDTVKIKSLGISDPTAKRLNWIDNIANSYEIKNISRQSSSKILLEFYDPHNLRIGDILEVNDNITSIRVDATVDDVLDETRISIIGSWQINQNLNYRVRKKITKCESSLYPYLNNYSANVQNTYTRFNNDVLVASSSLPYYYQQPLNPISKKFLLDGSYSGEVIELIKPTDTIKEHGLYTGDPVYYRSKIIIINEFNEVESRFSNLTDGVYYVYRVDSTSIKLARSRSDIFEGKFILLSDSVIENYLEYYPFYNKQLQPQNIFKEILEPNNTTVEATTFPGVTGILVNGTEILNYKSRDAIFYGGIESIVVESPGENYNIITPPQIIIEDAVGTGATAIASLSGYLDRIDILDPGFGYINNPTIEITGGNGFGAKTQVNTTTIRYSSFTNVEGESRNVNLFENTIGFSTYHKFKDAEKIVYITNGQTAISGLTTNSTYFAYVVDSKTIKLHNKYSDAILGINTISFSEYGSGVHEFRAAENKKIITSVKVIDGGQGYSNNQKVVAVSGINTSSNSFNIASHGYSDLEVVEYSTTGSSISGLSTSQQYIVKKVDNNNFKLCHVGLGTTVSPEFYYSTNQFVDITSFGSGTHSFNYPEIKVKVNGVLGISTRSDQDFSAKLQPVFKGSVSSVQVIDPGQNYGSSDVINYYREPIFSVRKGSGAQVSAIVNNGEIVEVLVLDGGRGYTSIPDLIISGNGKYQQLTPIVVNGVLTEVKVINGGTGHDSSTKIEVVESGSNLNLRAEIQKWNINLVEKNINSIGLDDGVITESLYDEKSLQYCHLYAPRKLREYIYSKDLDGKTLYGISDLRKSANVEIDSSKHSPIIGWAYDGNPIYGPYGYSTETGGAVRRMISGYQPITRSNRPPYPQGFFIEDYVFTNSGDLDKHNGRYCVTPEYPNGVYAYFATINSVSDTQGPFEGYRRPVFPYIIGDTYKSLPNISNISPYSSQLEYPNDSTKWFRNTVNYNLLGKKNSTYDFVYNPVDKKDQNINIEYARPGLINEISVVFGGDDYRVGDRIVFSNEDTGGSNAVANVLSVSGKSVIDITSQTENLFDVEFSPNYSTIGGITGISSLPHNYSNLDLVYISGFSTSFVEIEGSYKIGVSSESYVLSVGVGTTGVTGLTTYFYVSGVLGSARENDIYEIENEQIKILNIDTQVSRFRVLRNYNGTVGSAYSAGEVLYEKPRKFTINSTKQLSPTFNNFNREFYFDPSESVGLGTTSGVGITSTIVFSFPGVGKTQISIPTRSIYINNHIFKTGDSVYYNSNSNSPLVVSNTGIGTFSLVDNQKLYVAKISNDLIGLSTAKIGISSSGDIIGIGTTATNSLLYFISNGEGKYHSLKSENSASIFGQVSRTNVNVSTASTHDLQKNDIVGIQLYPKEIQTVSVKFDEYNRRIVFDQLDFISADVDIEKDTIYLQNHKFENGDKVIHTSSSPCGGLVNEKIYYVNIFSQNEIRLCNSYYESTKSQPIFVDISSSSFGSISKINPPINAFAGNTLKFDLSDPSLSNTVGFVTYSAFDLNFYFDKQFRNEFKTSYILPEFEVEKDGEVGISTQAYVQIKLNPTLPKVIYYKFEAINESFISDFQKELYLDEEVVSSNTIYINGSDYLQNSVNIVGVGSTTFTFQLKNPPEKLRYTQEDATITYTGLSTNPKGPISQVRILSGGKNYSTIPGISTVRSENGFGAILEPVGYDIGRIVRTRIEDIGFNYPSDFTLSPVTNLPEILKIEPLASFERIGISSAGRNYTLSPDLVVIDGSTNLVVDDVDLEYRLGDTEVKILKNTFGIYNTRPKIIPINNTNGVGISSITFDEITNDVTVGFNTGFSDVFPFSIGDRVLIENVSVGINSTGKGFNSKNYNYSLFTITQVNESLGGNLGSIVYNLSDYLSQGENPGIFDPSNSYGRVISEKDFPVFEPTLKKNNFIDGESIFIDTTEIGTVESWNSKNEYLKVSTNRDIPINIILSGRTSSAKGLVSNKLENNSYIQLGAFSEVIKGWKYETGFLNNSNQRLHDNFYYQYFSYSLKSRVSFDDWKETVDSLNHTAGFLKFSDLILESRSNQTDGVIQPIDSFTDVIVDIVGSGDLNCFYNFDLAREGTIEIDSTFVSNEIFFETTILTDYFESVGNRVLLIDDISGQFNSNPRITKYSEVSRFNLSDSRFRKYFTYVKDRRYVNERQLLIVDLLFDDFGQSFINQYGRMETLLDLGSFDAEIFGDEGILNFYPNKFTFNNYNIRTFSYNIKDSLVGTGTSTLGSVIVSSSSTSSSIGSTCNIVSVANTYSSIKALVAISVEGGMYEFDEINLVSNGSDVQLLEYGQLSNESLNPYSSPGLGSYYPYIDGSQLKIDFVPSLGIGVTINTIQVSIGNTLSSGIGTHYLTNAEFGSTLTSIASSTSPVETNIASYTDIYDCSYFIIQASDKNTGETQLSEVILIDDDDEVGITEYGIIYTSSSLGNVGASKTDSETYLTFTANPNTDVEVRTFYHSMKEEFDLNSPQSIDFTNSSIETDSGIYFGTDTDIKRSFDLTHQTEPIFARYFDGSDSNIVNLGEDTIFIPNHFFVTGEELVYSNSGAGTTQSIGIVTTFISGIGNTDKLPSSVYAVKVDDISIKLAPTAEKSLSSIPETFNFTSVGIETNHKLTSKKQNSKVLVTIDNMIQSPVVSTAITSSLSKNLSVTEDIIQLTGITSFFGGDLIKINDEIMRVNSVGFGSTNSIYVQRPWMGTEVSEHLLGSLVTKVSGNYNIVDNTIHFIDPPYGNIPIGTSTNGPNEVDWSGITTSSSFHGRVFLKTGVVGTSSETYSKNYILDDISTNFTGIGKTFILTSENQNISGIEDDNAIVVVNGIFQYPQGIQGNLENYNLTETSGITSITFSGNSSTQLNDINSFDTPVGGLIVSVGSSFGFGYQPLVSAGGTAVVSSAGTISAISIGNSGSGYRSGIQTFVNVGVQTYSSGIPSIEFIGTATISNGNIVSVTITNPGSGYTSTNPPIVVFDDPLSYSNIPLNYIGSGIGSQATIDIVVGQGSSVIDFSLSNIGYGYNVGDTLTVPVGGISGIPTDTSKPFDPFTLTVTRTFSDNFSGWSIGQLELLDNIEESFNGTRKTFPLKLGTLPITIRSSVGSNIQVKHTLLIFINDVLQIPDVSYIFRGGSTISFIEAPKEGDTCRILFYRGNGQTDVAFKDILETVKEGDTLQLNAEASFGQNVSYQQNERIVTGINTSDSLNTNAYSYPGVFSDDTVIRPITWCKQKYDVFIDGKLVPKSRIQYEPEINPTTKLIKSVGIGSTIFFVESIRPFFDPLNENLDQLLSSRFEVVSQSVKVAASATAIVSSAGTITSINIEDSGFGYVSAPEVSIENPIGLGTTSRAYAISSITSGIVTSINVISPGAGYTISNPPNVLVEYPQYNSEKLISNSYTGDFGIIVGISTTTGIASTAIAFDLLIPTDSYLRDSNITGLTTVSGIQTGYYFTIYNTNIGNGVTSLDDSGLSLGIGTQYLDNVYQVSSVSIESVDTVGYGTTLISRVIVSVSDYNSLTLTGIANTSFLGNYSWGRITVSERSKSIEHNAYPSNGLLGITTSDVVRRITPLKYLGYTS